MVTFYIYVNFLKIRSIEFLEKSESAVSRIVLKQLPWKQSPRRGDNACGLLREYL